MSFYAKVNIGAGGSWARDDDRDEALKRLGQIIIEDWGGTFDFPDVIEVDLWEGEPGESEPEVVQIKLPKRRKR